MPRVEGLESFRGKVIHSTSYRNAKEYRDEHVLVVGSGNSGMEIALDLANFGAKPSIVRCSHSGTPNFGSMTEIFNFSFGFIIINNFLIQFYSLINKYELMNWHIKKS